MKILSAITTPRFTVCKVRSFKVDVKNSETLVKERTEIIDLKTKNRYRYHSYYEMAGKVMFIFLFNPVVCFLKITFHVLQIGFDSFDILWTSVNMIKDLFHLRLISFAEKYVISRIRFCQALLEDLLFIVRTPFYSLAIQFSCVLTILAPNYTKKLIANIERKANYDMDMSFDYTNNEEFKNKPIYKAIFNMLLQRNQKIVFYLAPCFQPIGNLKDYNVIKPKTHVIQYL